MDLLRFLVMPFVIFLVVFAAFWVRDQFGERRRRQLRSGGPFHCRARLGQDPGAFRRGSVRLAGGALRWKSAGSGPDVDLAGVRVLARETEPEVPQARTDDVLLRLLQPDGAPLLMLLNGEDARALAEHLGARS